MLRFVTRFLSARRERCHAARSAVEISSCAKLAAPGNVQNARQLGASLPFVNLVSTHPKHSSPPPHPPRERDLWSYFADEEAGSTLGSVPRLSALAAARSGLALHFSSAEHVLPLQKLKRGYMGKKTIGLLFHYSHKMVNEPPTAGRAGQ